MLNRNTDFQISSFASGADKVMLPFISKYESKTGLKLWQSLLLLLCTKFFQMYSDMYQEETESESTVKWYIKKKKKRKVFKMPHVLNKSENMKY